MKTIHTLISIAISFALVPEARAKTKTRVLAQKGCIVVMKGKPSFMKKDTMLRVVGKDGKAFKIAIKSVRKGRAVGYVQDDCSIDAAKRVRAKGTKIASLGLRSTKSGSWGAAKSGAGKFTVISALGYNSSTVTPEAAFDGDVTSGSLTKFSGMEFQVGGRYALPITGNLSAPLSTGVVHHSLSNYSYAEFEDEVREESHTFTVTALRFAGGLQLDMGSIGVGAQGFYDLGIAGKATGTSYTKNTGGDRNGSLAAELKSQRFGASLETAYTLAQMRFGLGLDLAGGTYERSFAEPDEITGDSLSASIQAMTILGSFAWTL